MVDTSILIIGAGPAGTASAITALNAGLKVIIIERLRFPRYRPGESLHPGIQPLLAQLGVEQAVLDANFLRFSGIQMNWPDREWFESFGEDAQGSWQGFQAWRAIFDQILLDHAIALGAEVYQPCRVLDVLRQDERVIGINTNQGPIRARFVIDASGSRHWLADQLHIPVTRLTAPLFARYGYLNGYLDTKDLSGQSQDPILKIQDNGWLWIAPIDTPNNRGKQIHWTELVLPAAQVRKQPKQIPDVLSSLLTITPPVDSSAIKIQGADVTWRVMQTMAGDGYFAVGDAAFILDPISSHGVLRAIMSGIYTANLIVQSACGRIPEKILPTIYHDWMQTWLQTDVEKLKEFYAELPLSLL